MSSMGSWGCQYIMPGYHLRRKRGVCRGSDAHDYLCGVLICISPIEKKPNTDATCKLIQHVLRCCERQSDGSEYKKTLRRPGLGPGRRWGRLQRSRKPPSWWEGLAVPPQEP